MVEEYQSTRIHSRGGESMNKLYIAMETQNPNTKKYYPVVCPVSVECEDVITALIN